MKASDKITVSARKEVLYNGVSEEFVPFDEAALAQARENFGISEDEKVIAFVGNLSAVKNVMTLPEIFRSVVQLNEVKNPADSLRFIIAGDGKLMGPLQKALRALCADKAGVNVTFYGNLDPEVMPALMNCIDVLVLPSLNEGLPLVCAEALRCGANVVGSDAGGIAEVIGHENVVPLGEDFVAQMAEKTVDMLDRKPHQTLPEDISWKKTSARELSFLK
jgi:glycosyltransferase involved in cell wall biosynthesis